jgi:hypothetical protein
MSDGQAATVVGGLMRILRYAIIHAAVLTGASAAFATGGEGLKARADDAQWSRWQGRLSLSTTASSAWRSRLSQAEPAGLRVEGLNVAGDYYFGGTLFDRVSLGGLRATSGLIVGPRASATTGQPTLGAQGSSFAIERRLPTSNALSPGTDAPADLSSLPYFALGYTGLSHRGHWSFSADLGLVALSPGNVVKLGRVFGGTQSLDDMLRDLRWAPVLQMGVSYSF